MGYAYEDYCQDVYERDFSVSYQGTERYDEVKTLEMKLNSVEYWVKSIDEDMRNPAGVNIQNIDWMLEQLFDRLGLEISSAPLNIVSGNTQLLQVK